MAESLSTPFRRSLFIMLVVIGMITSGAFFYARDAKLGQTRSERERSTLSAKLDRANDNIAKLLERQQKTDSFVAQVLAGSSDPAVAGALHNLGVKPLPQADRRVKQSAPSTPAPMGPTPTRSSRPHPSPKPQPSPSPQPSPRPLLPVPLPVPVPCVILCPR